MDPVTMMAAIGFGAQAIGGIMGAKSQSQALEEQAQIAANNAYAARLKAKADAETQVIQATHVLNAQTADYAAAGVEGGSVFAVMADSAANAELDRLNIVFNGRVKSDAYMAQAASDMDAASNVRKSAIFNLAATGFQAGSKYAERKGGTT